MKLLPYALPQSAADDATRTAVNATQSEYVGLVLSRDGRTVMPSAIWNETVSSGLTLKADVPDIVSFVCGEMNWTREHLFDVLEPPQIDALARMIHGFKKDRRDDRDFGLLDEAGFGKGRVLISGAAWAVMNGMTPVVFTKTQELFSNLWQDAIDVGVSALFIRPFLLNDSVKIDNMQGSGHHFAGIPPKLHKATIANGGSLPEGFGIVMATWSQLAVKGSVKFQWLTSLVKNSKVMLIEDEAHMAALGASRISQSARVLRANSASACQSSATMARSASDMASFPRLYPWLAGVPLPTIADIPYSYKVWLAETSVSMATQNGRVIRREMDKRGVTLVPVLPSDDAVAANSHAADIFAAALRGMRDYWQSVNALVGEMNAKHEDRTEGESMAKARYRPAFNFYAKISVMAAQFDACLLADFVVERACAHLLEGFQPTIILSMTMEGAIARIRSLAPTRDDTDQVDDSDDFNNENDDAGDGDALPEGGRAITFRDILLLALNRCGVIIDKNGDEIRPDPDNLKGRLGSVGYHDAVAAINALPDLPGSPIDYIMERIEDRSHELITQGVLKSPWVVGEISGRSFRLDRGRRVAVTSSTNAVIASYNDGLTDLVIMTAAGSTGGSMHHTAGATPESNARRRKRSQIEAVPSQNPIERIQTYGRISRRGAITPPRYEAALTGTPHSLCRFAREGEKASLLTAASSGDHGNGLATERSNMLSAAGDAVARNLLTAMPELAAQIGLNLDLAPDDDETWHVRNLMSRSVLLDSAQVSTMMQRFRSGLDRGVLRVSHLKLHDIGSGWTLDQPTMTLLEPGLQTLKGSLSGLFLGDTGVAVLSRQVPWCGKREAELPPIENNNSTMAALVSKMAATIDNHLGASLPSWTNNVAAALAAKDNPTLYAGMRENRVVVASRRYQHFLNLAPALKVGAAFQLPDIRGNTRPAIITAIFIPENVFLWADYSVEYVVPSDDRTYSIDLTPLVDRKYLPIPNNAVARSRFRQQNDHYRTDATYLLVGNEARACLHAARINVGRRVAYEDAQGRSRKGIILSQPEYEMIMAAPLLVPGPDVAIGLLERGFTLFRRNVMTVKMLGRLDNGWVTIEIDTKGRNAKLDVILAGISKMPKASKVFRIPPHEVPRAIAALYCYHTLSCGSNARDALAETILEVQDAPPFNAMSFVSMDDGIPVFAPDAPQPPADASPLPRQAPPVRQTSIPATLTQDACGKPTETPPVAPAPQALKPPPKWSGPLVPPSPPVAKPPRPLMPNMPLRYGVVIPRRPPGR